MERRKFVVIASVLVSMIGIGLVRNRKALNTGTGETTHSPIETPAVARTAEPSVFAQTPTVTPSAGPTDPSATGSESASDDAQLAALEREIHQSGWIERARQGQLNPEEEKQAAVLFEKLTELRSRQIEKLQ